MDGDAREVPVPGAGEGRLGGAQQAARDPLVLDPGQQRDVSGQRPVADEAGIPLVPWRGEVREPGGQRLVDGVRQRRVGVPGAQAASGSRRTGQDMQRGPPRPVPSSEPAIRTTSTPASSSRPLVTVLRS